MAALGVILPGLFQIVSDNVTNLAWLDGSMKSDIRLAFLVAVIALRPFDPPRTRE